MTVERWEIRFGCAIGMAIYIHLTASIWDGLFTMGTLLFCMFYASMPAIQKWLDARAARRHS